MSEANAETREWQYLIVLYMLITIISTGSFMAVRGVNEDLKQENNALYSLVYVENITPEQLERMIMYLPKNQSMFLNGYYKHDKYYCVWTGNRNLDEIKKTDYHEACHHFVHMDEKHWCEGKDQVNWSKAAEFTNCQFARVDLIGIS